MVNAGSLRHVCEVWQPVETTTAKGDVEFTYAQSTEPLDIEYCSIEPLQGRELLFARQVVADVTHKISFRYRRDITHKTQLRWYDGTETHKYELGPLVDKEARQVIVTVYAIERK
jgi:head-tail adaptor